MKLIEMNRIMNEFNDLDAETVRKIYKAVYEGYVIGQKYGNENGYKATEEYAAAAWPE